MHFGYVLAQGGGDRRLSTGRGVGVGVEETFYNTQSIGKRALVFPGDTVS